MRRFLNVSVMAHNASNALRIDRIELATNPTKHFLAIEHRFAFAIQFDRIALARQTIDAVVEPLHPSVALGKQSRNDERMQRWLAVLHLAALPVAFLFRTCKRVPY